MKLTLVRRYFTTEYTIGDLLIDGVFFCNTIEDRIRENGKKVQDVTAIPFGAYRVIVTYSPAFKRIMPLLLKVPGFSGVRVHRGNTAEDTSGCIIVGENKIKGKVINSKETEKQLMERLKGQTEIEIEII